MLNFLRENETVYMVMNYLQGDTLQDFIITARELKKQKVFRESTIRSLFDEILRGLRIVHQHKMLHLDIKPANIFITDDNRAVMIDFGAARLPLETSDGTLRLGDAVTVPVLGGALRLEHLSIAPPGGGETLSVRFGLGVEDLDVARLSEALRQRDDVAEFRISPTGD